MLNMVLGYFCIKLLLRLLESYKWQGQDQQKWARLTTATVADELEVLGY